MIRRRLARLFENALAAIVGAVIVALAQGMTPTEIVDVALNNADKLPAILGQWFAMPTA